MRGNNIASWYGCAQPTYVYGCPSEPRVPDTAPWYPSPGVSPKVIISPIDTGSPPAGFNAELEAMRVVYEALKNLPGSARARVYGWVNSRIEQEQTP
jgi:hypothetical protein